MDKLLTISIAAYHVEKYLAETLQSFLVPEADECLEVLIINDGSGEEINAIAREYEEKYPHIFRLIDKENGGHGSTVNRGIEEAKGQYFKTVDGDDRVEREGFRELLSYLMQATEDLIITDYYRFDDKTGEGIDIIRYEFAGKETKKTYRFEEVSDMIYVNMHAATFRTEILKTMERRLDEHCFYVDAEYMLYPIPLVETVAFLEKPVYEYRLGMTTQSMDIKNMQKNCSHHEKVLEHLLQFYEAEKDMLSDKKKIYVERGVARILASQIKIYLSYETERKWRDRICQVDKEIKEKYPAVYRATDNIAVKVLRLSGYRLYALASKACRKAYHCE